MRDLLVIGVVVICSFIALRRPVFGLLTFVCLGFLNPQSMTWTIGRTFPLSQLVGIGTIVGYLFWSEPKRFPLQRESFLLLALWGMFAVSTLFAIYPDRALDRFMHVSKILLMVFLSMSLINTEQRLHFLLRVIALSLGFYGLKGGIFTILTAGKYMVWGPDNSFLAANNAIGLALAMNIPLLFYFLKIETRPWLRWIIRAMLVFSYPAVVATYSRGAWLGLAIVTALIVLRSKHKLLLGAAAAILMIMILPVLPQFLPQRVLDRYDILVNYEEDSSAQTRLWSWEFCKRVGLAHPLVGGGFDFNSTELGEIEYPEFDEQWGAERVWSCHSMWFTIFGEHGFPGIILWAGLMGSYLFSLRQMRSYGRVHAELSWVIHYADMLQAALVAFMVVGTFLDAAYFDMFYYLVAILVIIKERIRRAAAEASSAVTLPGVDMAASSSKRLLVGGEKTQPLSV